MGEVRTFRRMHVDNENFMHFWFTQGYQFNFVEELNLMDGLNDGIRLLGNDIRVKQRYSSASNIRTKMLELYDHAIKLKLEFSDLPVRLYHLVQIKLTLKKLYDYTNQIDDHKHLHHAVIMLYDALRKVKAEEIVKEQAEAIYRICRMVTSMNVTEKDVDQIDDILLEAELDWVMGG